MAMVELRVNRSTAIVDAVAFEVQKSNFRGNVFGQNGLYIDKESLCQHSDNFDLNEFTAQVKELHAYVEENGSIRF